MTGLRPGEAKGLKVKDLDPICGRLMIRRDVDDLGHEDSTKTRNHRDVPIGGEILVLLDRNAQGKDPDAWLISLTNAEKSGLPPAGGSCGKTCASGLGLVTSTPTSCATLPHPSPSQPELMLKQYNLCSATPVPL